MKILVLGHGGHGKDETAKVLESWMGLSWISSSQAAAEMVYPVLAELYGYESVQECWEQRKNCRSEWRQLISDYNTPDKGRLCREILAHHDCYVGMRCHLEYAATKELFGLILWVDAANRMPQDPSMTIPFNAQTMVRIDNNGPQSALHKTVETAVALALIKMARQAA